MNLNNKLITIFSNLILAIGCGNLTNNPPIRRSTDGFVHLTDIEIRAEKVERYSNEFSLVEPEEGRSIYIGIRALEPFNLFNRNIADNYSKVSQVLKRNYAFNELNFNGELSLLIYLEKEIAGEDGKRSKHSDFNIATPEAYSFLKSHPTDYLRNLKIKFDLDYKLDFFNSGVLNYSKMRVNVFSVSYDTEPSSTPPNDGDKDSDKPKDKGTTQYYTSIPNQENSYARIQMLYIDKKYCNDGYENPSNCADLDARFYQHYVLFPNVTSRLPNNWKKWYKLDNYIVLSKEIPIIDNITPRTEILFNYWKSNWNKYFYLTLYEYIPSVQPKNPIYYIKDFSSTIPKEEKKEPKEKNPIKTNPPVNSPQTFLTWIKSNPWVFYPIVGTLLSILTGSLVKLILLPLNKRKVQRKVGNNQNDSNK